MTPTKPSRQAYQAPPLLVVTDLDGTLLDHYTYDFARAREALETIRRLGIPLVPNTSKTNAEMRPLRERLGSDDAFIVENGSAIFLPRSRFSRAAGSQAFSQDLWVIELGAAWQSIVDRLEGLAEEFDFTGFHTMELRQLMQITGLGEDQAERAMRRRFSVPVLWQDSDAAQEAFITRLQGMGLSTLQGGRFLHVLGRVDKGMALNQLRAVYEQTFGLRFRVIALGDSPNDAAMLEAADIPVIIRSPVHEPPVIKSSNEVIVSRYLGPKGWNETILNLLENF